MPEIIILISLSIIFVIILRKLPKVEIESKSNHEANSVLRGETETDNIEILENQIENCLVTKDYGRAETICLDLITKKPHSGEYYAQLGNIYLMIKNFEDAKEAFLEAVKYDSDNGLWYNNLGLTFFNLKQFGKAIGAYNRAIEIDPKIAGRYVNLGLVYLSLGNRKKAREYFRQAVNLEPSNSKYRKLYSRTEGTRV